MAQAIIGGVAYWISPFRLRELRLAAPFIDKVSARAREGALATVQGASEAAYDMLCVLAVGIEGANPDQLAADATVEDLAALRTAFDQVMEEAGLKQPGEPRPATPATPDPTDPSATASTTSPPSSSLVDAATGTPSSAAST